MKKKEKDFRKMTDDFCKEVKTIIKEKDGRCMFVMGSEDTDDGKTSVLGCIIGSKRELVCTLAMAMEENDEVRETLEDAVEFYKFKKSPISSLTKTLKNLLDEVEKEVAKRKGEPVEAEEIRN